MISNDLIQAAIISKLKADSALIEWLTERGSSKEIRENQWQGRSFSYPAVRVDLGTQTEQGNPPCYSTMPFSIYSYTEDDSSQLCDVLAGLVNAALLRKRFSGTGFSSGIVIADGLTSAARSSERVWRAAGLYRCNIYGGIL